MGLFSYLFSSDNNRNLKKVNKIDKIKRDKYHIINNKFEERYAQHTKI